MTEQGYINHIGLVLDASSSMTGYTKETIAVADGQVKYLAQRSQEMDQETRMSVYTFNTEVRNVYYDKDVLRLPSLSQAYRPNGMTALVSATLKAITDLEQTATLYGDHAFLLYVLTDGQENASPRSQFSLLQDKLKRLPDNWTVAVLVPDQQSVYEAKKFGFAPDNIAIWDTTSSKGVVEVGEKIRQATDNYMYARSQGIRSTRGIFTLDTQNLTPQTIKSTLKPLDKNEYATYPVHVQTPIKEFVETNTMKPYSIGSAFYELTKPEDVQASKQIVIRDKKNWGGVYSGPQARQLLGLPDYQVRVHPSQHPDFEIFVQSTSVNRKLVPGSTLLVLK